MSYDTDHDFDWVLEALRPRGQVPGAAPQELPHHVSDVIAPRFDALAWQRYGSLLFESASGVNPGSVSLAAVPSDQAKLYPYVQVRAAGGTTAGVWWIGINDGTNVVAVSESKVIVAGEGSSLTGNRVLVPAGFFLQARSDQVAGVGIRVLIEAFAIALNTAEYVLPT